MCDDSKFVGITKIKDIQFKKMVDNNTSNTSKTVSFERNYITKKTTTTIQLKHFKKM